MRTFWVTALFALLLNIGTSLPAAAGASDHVRAKDIRDRADAESDDRQRMPRKRLARASTSDIDDDFEASPRRRYQADDGNRPRYTKRRHARSAKRARHHHRVARRSTRRVAHDGARRMRRADRRVTRSNVVRGHLNGVASYYWQGRQTATGARFNPEGLTAAHRTLPFGTRVRVTHLGNGRSVNVVINDRGPYIGGRVIDLARGAARVIGMTGQGLARVNVTILGR
jgi:rare lipoprotein A